VRFEHRDPAGIQPWPQLKPFLSFGPATQTVGETSRWLATHSAAALLAPDEGWSRQLIENLVTRLMTEELGVSAFRWTDHFVRDLRLE
jgi:hypothetical protein